MSSFIVSQECMNNIINGLFWNHDFNRFYGGIIKRYGYDQDSKSIQRLGDDLYNLNHLGTGERYNDQRLLYCMTKFEWKSQSVNKYQVLKSLHCLRYQCSEDRADEQTLYKMLDELITAWSDYIISENPEYENARWD